MSEAWFVAGFVWGACCAFPVGVWLQTRVTKRRTRLGDSIAEMAASIARNEKYTGGELQGWKSWGTAELVTNDGAFVLKLERPEAAE